MKVLLFEPNLSQTIALAKYLKKADPEIHVTICNPSVLQWNHQWMMNTRYFDAFLTLPIDEWGSIEGFDYIIPTGTFSTATLLRKRDKLEYEECSFSANILSVSDKLPLLEKVSGLGYPIPQTSPDPTNIQFPVFYKSSREVPEQGKIRGLAKEESGLPANYSDLIFQEYLPDRYTYGVGFMAISGEIKCSLTHRESVSYPKTGGSAVFLETYQNKKLESYTRGIISELRYTGWGLAEFKYCKRRNDFVFMEINAKWWASSELAFINEPGFIKSLIGKGYEAKQTRKMFWFERYLQSDLSVKVKFFHLIFSYKHATWSLQRLSYFALRMVIKPLQSIFKV